MSKTSRQKISRDTKDSNINEAGMYRILHPTRNTDVSITHRREHMLSIKKVLMNFKRLKTY